MLEYTLTVCALSGGDNAYRHCTATGKQLQELRKASESRRSQIRVVRVFPGPANSISAVRNPPYPRLTLATQTNIHYSDTLSCMIRCTAKSAPNRSVVHASASLGLGGSRNNFVLPENSRQHPRTGSGFDSLSAKVTACCMPSTRSGHDRHV